MTLLGVVDNLNHRIESLDAHPPPTDSDSMNEERGITGDPEVDGLSSQLAEIENVDYTLEKTLTSMKIDLERIQAGWRGTLVRFFCFSSLLPPSASGQFNLLPTRHFLVSR